MTSKFFQTTRRHALLMGAAAGLLPAVSARAAMAEPATLQLGRNQSFDLNWKFFKGTGEGLEAQTLDDAKWRVLDLPHDWSIEDLAPQPDAKQVGPFDPRSEGGAATGFTLGGEGWYRKHLTFTRHMAGSHVELVFGSVSMVADVWLNGQHLTTHYHGYTAFVCDLTPYLVVGDNVIAVRARNIGKTSRWYPGSGIYRSVTLDVVPQKTRINNRGVSLMTRRIGDTGAQIDISTEVADLGPGVTLVTAIRDAAGHIVASGETKPSATAPTAQSLLVPSPALWSPDTPVLYSVETELRIGKRAIDRFVTPLGIRVVTFDPDGGMAINGEPTKLRGGCVHHDNGLLGAVSFPDAEDRRMGLLKARGYNAIRCSHNPPSQAFADAADRHGMLLIVEAFDSWSTSKLPQDYGLYFEDHWKEDLESMVRSHRNHPSVIMWSIGNEIPKRSTYHGVETGWQLANATRRLDPTRPVTAAINGFNGRLVKLDPETARPGFADAPDESAVAFLDVVGYNYKLDRYEPDHLQFPKRILYGSESFPLDMFDIWPLTDAKPYILGDFVWSAADYLGEAGVGSVQVFPAKSAQMMKLAPAGFPWVDSYCGDIDLIGHRKAPSYARDVVWGLSQIEMAVMRPTPDGQVQTWALWGWPDELPSWTWPGQDGRTLSVTVYTKGDRVDLFLNDQPIGSKAMTAADRMQAKFDVPYKTGTLRAVASRSGVEVARKELATLGPAAAVRLAAGPLHRASRNALAYVPVEIVDGHGNILPDATNDLSIAVSGAAELVGFGSGYPKARGSFQSNSTAAFHGAALAILRSTGKPGRVNIAVKAEALLPGVTQIQFT